MSAIRWLSLVPGVVAVWYGVFALGLLTHSFIESHLCPPEDLFSGLCYNSTVQLWLKVTMHAFVAVSAVAVVSSATILAPGHKNMITWLTLAVGAATAAYLAAVTHEWGLFASAIAGGLTGLVASLYWIQRAAPNNALQATCEDARA